MRIDHAVTKPSTEPVAMRRIEDRMTHVKTLPSLEVVNYHIFWCNEIRFLVKALNLCVSYAIEEK